MNRYISYFLFFTCLIFLTPLYAATQTLTTYYPAPKGNYLDMTVNQTFTLLTQATNCNSLPTGAGQTYLVNFNGEMEVCDANGSYFLTNTSLWSKGATAFIYPTLTSQNVGIGAATAPAYTLGVTGTLGVSGLTTLSAGATVTGTGAGTTALQVNNGNVQIGNGGVQPNLVVLGDYAGVAPYIGIFNSGGDQHLTIQGVGSGPTNPADIISMYGLEMTVGAGSNEENGFRVNWGAGNPVFEVLGNNVGIGPDATSPSAALQVDGVASVTLGSATPVTIAPPPVKVCNSSGTNCGYLIVAQPSTCGSPSGDCNWYAVYGP